MRDAKGVRTVPASLAVFGVRSDGKLDFVRKYNVPVGSKNMFWVGITRYRNVVEAGMRYWNVWFWLTHRLGPLEQPFLQWEAVGSGLAVPLRHVNGNKLLNPFAGLDFAGVDVPVGVRTDGVDLIEHSGHTAFFSERTNRRALLTIDDPDLIVRHIRDVDELLLRSRREGYIQDGSAASEFRAADSTFRTAGRSKGGRRIPG